MTIQEQLQQDLKTAMRAGDRQRTDVLRMALAALKNEQIALVKAAYDAAPDAAPDAGRTLSAAEMQSTIAREVKRRHDAAEVYRQASRADLAEAEEQEAVILTAYLPKQLSAEELRPLVAAAISDLGASGPADLGKVMPTLMQQFKSRADGRLINQLARELLSKP